MNSTAELICLDTIEAPEDKEVGGGFSAMVEDQEVEVRAVLERTAVVEYPGGKRCVVRKNICFVEESTVPFVTGNPHTGVGPRQWRRLPGKPPKPMTAAQAAES
ncbi:MAG: hypothetical protein ACREP9_14670 [Candidatus Dormibacteraceae bacterium]